MRQFLAALLAALLAGCGGLTPGEPPGPTAALMEVDARLSAASVAFGIDLLKEVYDGGNALLSPVSASLVLSITGGGARGETQQEFWRALRLDALAADEIHAGNQALQAVLTRPDPRVEVALANAIWHRPDVAVLDAFADMAGEYYGAAVDEADFGTRAGTDKINDWTAEQTRGKIEKLFDETLGGNTVMVLANALYFKGAWSEAFNPKLTRGGTFTTAAGAERTLLFMERDGEWAVLTADPGGSESAVQGVRLPYGEGRVAMYLFVPDDLDRFVADLTPQRWAELMEGFTARNGLVRVPKFTLEATHVLNDPLKALGLLRAFDGTQADFTGIFGEERRGVEISRVLQKTFMEVSEEGTEAAAATAVEMSGSAPLPLLEVNRPFLVAICDDETGALLFLGAVTDPGPSGR